MGADSGDPPIGNSAGGQYRSPYRKRIRPFIVFSCVVGDTDASIHPIVTWLTLISGFDSVTKINNFDLLERPVYRENYINALRTELLEMVERYLSPVALQYDYSEVPLETNIKWRPQVLVLGNYSSGKSTLINDLLGGKIQATGQAPTDDSFTVITDDDSTEEGNPSVVVTEERDGKYLLNDSEYPFESLKKHGERFAAHFRLKKVNSPFLKNLAIIDTPGMLDSITERDRGYNYQEVIGDLAQIADLVLILFDPHKAGTVREAHTSLRDTLPARTFEDRVLFVLNRIDECNSLIDLLQVYGTLCWNLSQMTGRKDIPTIHLVYSQQAAEKHHQHDRSDAGYLQYLGNQREDLKKAVLDAPRYRLDNLASFVETHGERLSHLLEALVAFRRKKNGHRARLLALGLLGGIIVGVGALIGAMVSGLAGALDQQVLLLGGGGVAGVFFLGWLLTGMGYFSHRFHEKQLLQLDHLTPLNTQTRRDNWDAIRHKLEAFLRKTDGRFSLSEAKTAFASLRNLCETGTREVREALSELATIHDDRLGEPDGRILSEMDRAALEDPTIVANGIVYSEKGKL